MSRNNICITWLRNKDHRHRIATKFDRRSSLDPRDASAFKQNISLFLFHLKLTTAQLVIKKGYRAIPNSTYTDEDALLKLVDDVAGANIGVKENVGNSFVPPDSCFLRA